MAELTTLEEKLAEVTGLARPAKDLSEKVAGLVEDEDNQGSLAFAPPRTPTPELVLPSSEAGT
jgi:hypothetical protein